MTTEAFSQNVGKVFYELKLVTFFIYAGANLEATEKPSNYFNTMKVYIFLQFTKQLSATAY